MNTRSKKHILYSVAAKKNQEIKLLINLTHISKSRHRILLFSKEEREKYI